MLRVQLSNLSFLIFFNIKKILFNLLSYVNVSRSTILFLKNVKKMRLGISINCIVLIDLTYNCKHK